MKKYRECGKKVIYLSTGQKHNVYTHQRLFTLSEEKGDQKDPLANTQENKSWAYISLYTSPGRQATAWMPGDLTRKCFHGMNMLIEHSLGRRHTRYLI